MAWDYRRFARLEDPAHKSHLGSITGDYGCLKSFRYGMDAAAAGLSRESPTECNGKATAGTATHEAIARALSNPDVLGRLLAGKGKVTAEQCQMVYEEEWLRAVRGREVRWFSDDNADDIAIERAAMIAGVLNDLRNHVAEVVFVEPGFIVQIGEYWTSGHVDLLYRPVSDPTGLAIADWKTGATKPHPIELDHGWESGIYSAAVHSGIWIPREHVAVEPSKPLDPKYASRYERERLLLEAELIRVAKGYAQGELPEHATLFEAFPSEIRYVHLADYPVYKKAGKKAIKRPEEIEFFKLDGAGEHKFKAGERRGPAWYRIRRTEHDIPRLESLLKNVVGTVRMGRFFESVGDKCERCAWKAECLTGGYEVRGDERKQLEATLAQVKITDDGLGNVA